MPSTEIGHTETASFCHAVAQTMNCFCFCPRAGAAWDSREDCISHISLSLMTMSVSVWWDSLQHWQASQGHMTVLKSLKRRLFRWAQKPWPLCPCFLGQYPIGIALRKISLSFFYYKKWNLFLSSLVGRRDRRMQPSSWIFSLSKDSRKEKCLLI